MKTGLRNRKSKIGGRFRKTRGARRGDGYGGREREREGGEESRRGGLVKWQWEEEEWEEGRERERKSSDSRNG